MVLCDFKNRRCVLCCGKRHVHKILYYPRGLFCELFGLVENEPAGWMSLVIKRHLGVPGEVAVSVCISASHQMYQDGSTMSGPSALMLAVPAKSAIATIAVASE